MNISIRLFRIDDGYEDLHARDAQSDNRHPTINDTIPTYIHERSLPMEVDPTCRISYISSLLEVQ